jgi:phosphoglycerol transferase MdoB-like AlkP superfamily enzyme
MQKTIEYMKRLRVLRIPLLLWSLLTVVVVELLSRGRWTDTFGWTFGALPQLILNALIVLALLLLLGSIIGGVRISFWIISAVAIIFGLISGIKLQILGVPFLPWDLALTSETQDMAQYLKGLFGSHVLIGLASFIVLGIVLLYKLTPISLSKSWLNRVIIGVASLAILASMYSDGPVSIKKIAHVENITWDQTENVKTNGFLLSTLMNIRYLFQTQPDEYNADAIQALAAASQKDTSGAEGKVKPNIVVVLSESFWDATKLENVKFSRDPLAFYHSLEKNYSSGTMLSPQYGGGTANVEFEVLTGNTMRFLPQGSVPYNQYINSGIDSLASILTRQGYSATAISPFHNWFFNSRKVYENLGFGKFIPQEFFNPVYEGPYIADREVANEIIQASKSNEGPDFIFANTMQNHYHYYPGKFKENTIDVTGVEGEAKGLLETYAQGLLGVDDMLKQLVKHFEASDEPTILVFFGDHLPSLGDNYSAYKDSGYLQENDPNFLDKMYRVPVLIWNNYLPKEQKETLDMSTNFLGPYILNAAQRPGNYVMDYLSELYKKMPILPPENHYADLGIQKEDLKEYEQLQYDILFGEKHGYAEIKDKIINPNYRMGHGPIQIEAASLESGGKQLVIQGLNMPHQGIVHINGKPAATQWVSQGKLTAAVPADVAAGSSWTIQVKIKDSKEIVIATSNEFVYDAK